MGVREEGSWGLVLVLLVWVVGFRWTIRISEALLSLSLSLLVSGEGSRASWSSLSLSLGWFLFAGGAPGSWDDGEGGGFNGGTGAFGAK